MEWWCNIKTELLGGTDGIGATAWRSSLPFTNSTTLPFLWNYKTTTTNLVHYRNIWIRDLKREAGGNKYNEMIVVR